MINDYDYKQDFAYFLDVEKNIQIHRLAKYENYTLMSVLCERIDLFSRGAPSQQNQVFTVEKLQLYLFTQRKPIQAKKPVDFSRLLKRKKNGITTLMRVDGGRSKNPLNK